MPYTVYKVTNKLTGEFYIGVHKTNDPHDSYLGSGKVIRAQVALHGPESFTKEILASFNRRQDAYAKEAELVNPLVGTTGCLNLHPGGHGGFGYVNHRGLNSGGNQDARVNQSRRDKRLERFATDPEFLQQQLDRLREAQRLNPERTRAIVQHAAKVRAEHWRGGRHTLETRQKLRETHLGNLNSQHGTAWVNHPQRGEVRKVKVDELPTYLADGWRRGRVL